MRAILCVGSSFALNRIRRYIFSLLLDLSYRVKVPLADCVLCPIEVRRSLLDNVTYQTEMLLKLRICDCSGP